MKFCDSMLTLYAVTDRRWAMGGSFYAQCEESIKAGVTMLQLREKYMSDEEMIEEGKGLKRLTASYSIPLIINDRVEVALACDADGVHVGQEDGLAAAVRKRLGPNKILGVTAKTIEQAKQAEAMGADYLGVGAVFGSSTKIDAKSITIEQLKVICKAVSIPVVAIGGITGENMDELKGSGIAGIAVVSAVFASEQIQRDVSFLKEKVGRLLED